MVFRRADAVSFRISPFLQQFRVWPVFQYRHFPLRRQPVPIPRATAPPA
jgi:hypothetical protein